MCLINRNQIRINGYTVSNDPTDNKQLLGVMETDFKIPFCFKGTAIFFAIRTSTPWDTETLQKHQSDRFKSMDSTWCQPCLKHSFQQFMQQQSHYGILTHDGNGDIQHWHLWKMHHFYVITLLFWVKWLSFQKKMELDMLCIHFINILGWTIYN